MHPGPIFLKAIPRSGGTLFITILDAHPLIAMSYEIYEEGLVGEGKNPLAIETVLAKLRRLRVGKEDDTKIIRKIDNLNLRTFLFRARRGGLSVFEIVQQMEIFFESGGNFLDVDGRLNFIEMLMQLKMHKSGKRYWGGKTQSDLVELSRRNPGACFFIMIRDIRDVFASMCNTGNFKYTAEQAVNIWKDRINDFHNFALRNSTHTMAIHYEELVKYPEKVLKNACSLIGADYSSDMLNYHSKDLTLFQNPHGHLSMQQIKKGLNSESIGRWKRDLTTKDIETITKIAGELLNDWD